MSKAYRWLVASLPSLPAVVERYIKRARKDDDLDYLFSLQGGVTARKRYLVEHCPEFNEAVEAMALLRTLDDLLRQDTLVTELLGIRERLKGAEEASSSRHVHDALYEGRLNAEAAIAKHGRSRHRFTERRNLRASMHACVALAL